MATDKTKEELEEVFNSFDTNGNGFLESEEIIQAA
jgi:Ca2+-binding EF-hand superfamily protein